MDCDRRVTVIYLQCVVIVVIIMQPVTAYIGMRALNIHVVLVFHEEDSFSSVR